VLFFVFAYLFSDNWIEGQIESVASGVVGAKVELDNFDLDLLALNAGWTRLQVTDPNDTWKNIIETGIARFNIAAEPLLYNRWIIEELRLEDFRSGTKRETDGKLPDEQIRKSDEPSVFDTAVESMKTELSQSVGFDLTKLDKKVNVDSVIKILELKTPAKIDTFRKDIQITVNNWQKEVQSLSAYEMSTKKMIDQLQTIKVDQLKTLDQITGAVATVTRVRDQVDSLQKSIKNKRNTFIQDWARLEGQTKSVNYWVRADIQNAANKARLPDLSAKNMAKILFGPLLADRIETGLKYLNIAHKYGKKLAPTNKVESPPRFKGQDVLFPDRRKMPKFWLKEMVISGETGASPENRGLILAGNLLNLSTNPKTVGKPTELKLSSSKVGKTAYELLASIDRSQDVKKDIYAFKVADISLNNADLGGSGVLPKKVSKGIMDVSFDLNLVADELNGKIDIKTKALSFVFDDQKKDRFAAITHDILQNIGQIDVNLQFAGKPENLNLKLNSNLDNIFANRFKSLVSGEIVKGRAEIERRIRAKLEPKRKQALQFYTQKRNEIETKVSELENKINEKVQFVENKKKELEKKFEEEKKKQTDDLRKKAEDKLKSLLKKKK